MAMMSWLFSACAAEPPQNLGAKDGILAVCPSSPNCVSSQATDERHRIAPLSYFDDPDSAFARLKNVLKDRRDSTIVESTENYIRAELRTIFFVDDVEFLLDRESRLVQIRSASRLGYSDLGKNRSRMEAIRSAFERTVIKGK